MSYTRIASEPKDLASDQESVLSYNDEHARFQPRSRPTTTIVLSIALGISIILNIVTTYFSFHPPNLDAICFKHTTLHASPISDGIPITYETTHLNGTFSTENIYRQRASPAVDKAWHDLIGLHLSKVSVPASQAEHYGLQPWQVKLSPSTPGLPSSEPHLVADVEVFHQLHCLDMLRRGSHWDFPYYHARDVASVANGGEPGPFSADDESSRVHYSHCVDMLRQRLMCSADVELVGQVWLKDDKTPAIMFGGERTCRNFDDIKQWFSENRVKENEQGKILVEYAEGDRIFGSVAEIP